MMKFTTPFARTAVAAAFLFAAAGAQAAAISITSNAVGTTGVQATSYFDKAIVPGRVMSVVAAPWTVTDGSESLLAFCIDPGVDMHTNLGASYSGTAYTSFSSSVDNLYSLFYGSAVTSGTADTKASFQLALWELHNDYATGSSLTAGKQILSSTANGSAGRTSIISLTNTMLSDVKTSAYITPKYEYTLYSIAGNTAASQSLVAANLVSAVPEPSTYAMMGLGLAMMGLVARRRKQA